MIKEAIKKLVAGNDLTFDEAAQVMDEMFSGTATQSQMAAYLTALRIKGETIDEITASAQVMREKALHIKPNRDVLDIVGTGGDGTGTFNISTTAAFIIAAAGIPVAKHGNRSMSSKSGSADCLEQLGININITPEKSEEVLNKAGICFMFAQGYHSSMKYVGPVRKEIGIRNIFNVLGPLTNPAGADLQVTGVYSEALVEPIAQVSQTSVLRKAMFSTVWTVWTRLLSQQQQRCVRLTTASSTHLFSIPKITVLNFVHPRILQAVTAKKVLKSQKKFSAVKLRTQSVISLFSMLHSDFAQAARQIQFRTA